MRAQPPVSLLMEIRKPLRHYFLPITTRADGLALTHKILGLLSLIDTTVVLRTCEIPKGVDRSAREEFDHHAPLL